MINAVNAELTTGEGIMNGWASLREYLDSPAACSHRLGALIFRRDGMMCPTCGTLYRWGHPLDRTVTLREEETS